MKFTKKFRESLLLIVFTVLTVWLVFNYDIVLKMLGWLVDVMWPVILGAIMAFILNVPMSGIEKIIFKHVKKEKTKKITDKLKRPFAIILTFVLAIGVVMLLCFLVIPALGETLTSLSKDIPVAVKRISEEISSIDWLNNLISRADINRDKIVSTLTNWISNGVNVLSTLDSTVTIATSIFSSIINFVLGIFFAIYILAQKETLKRQFSKVSKAFLPHKAHKTVSRIADMSVETFKNFLTGQCCDALILGTMCTLGMMLFRFPNALLIGMLVAVTALIPIVGACIGTVVGFLLICVSSFSQAVWFVIFLQVLQQIEGNFIYPKVVGNSVGLPSLWVLFSITVGGNMLGIFGMFLAVPVCSVLFSIFSEYVNNRIEKKKSKALTEDATTVIQTPDTEKQTE